VSICGAEVYLMVLACRIFGHKWDFLVGELKKDNRTTTFRACSRCLLQQDLQIPSQCEVYGHEWDILAQDQPEGTQQPKALLFYCKKCHVRDKVPIKA